jgi:hypothetical protein
VWALCAEKPPASEIATRPTIGVELSEPTFAHRWHIDAAWASFGHLDDAFAHKVRSLESARERQFSKRLKRPCRHTMTSDMRSRFATTLLSMPSALTPFDSTAIDDLVLEYLAGFLDPRGVEIGSRWHGTYVKHPTKPFCVLEPAPNVTAVVGGAGMTLSFGAAAHVVP